MQIYEYDPTTLVFTGTSTAHPSPLEPGTFLVPAFSTVAAPLEQVEGKSIKFIGGAWQYEDIPTVPVPPQPTIAEIAHSKLERINTGKNTSLDGGFTHNGVLFDSDSKARLAYLEFAHKLSTSPLYSTPWKASTGHWVTMDATLFSALQPAYEQHIQACFVWQAAREMEVAAAVSAGSIEGVKAVAEII
jgi:hypothetical protein